MRQVLFCLLLVIGNWATNTQAQNATNMPCEHEVVSNLVLAIRQEPHADSDYKARVAAIKEAAEMQNPPPAIIEALLDNIMCFAERIVIDPMSAPKYGAYPARDALITIGKPITPLLLEKLKSANDEESRIQYVSLLQEIEGKEQSIELLKQAISGLSQQQSNLEKSLKMIH